MYIEISFVSIVDILSVSTSFMLGLLFLTSKSRKNKANIFLGLFLWSLSIEVLFSFLNGQDIVLPESFSLSELTLPFLFFYVVKTLNYKIKAIFGLLLIPFFFQLFDDTFAYTFISYGFGLFILFYTLRLLKKHNRSVGDYYSDIENKTLSWIKTIIYIYLFFYAFWITEDLIGSQFEFVVVYFAITSTVLTLVMIYWIGYNGFSQPEIFDASVLILQHKKNINDDKLAPTSVEVETRQNEIQKDGNSEDRFNRLSQKIREDRLFLQKDLTIRNLSQQLGINEKEFSSLINTHTQKNFYHYINQFRVEEFKRLLKTEKAQHLSLLGLSEEAGFHSKSTFYSVFKSSEGITPKQYQNQLNQLNKSE